MSCSIGDPYLLSSYGLPKTPKRSASTSDMRPRVYATHGQTSSSHDGYVTVTAQADGVHILDLSTLHPTISHTLGPSTTFSCPAVSRYTNEDGATICTTYTVIEYSPGIPDDERGRTIWMWRQNMSHTLDKTAQKKISSVVPHTVSRMYVPKDLPSRLFLLSPKGDLTIMDALTLTRQSTRPPGEAHSVKTVVVLFYSLSRKINVEVWGVDEEQGVVSLGSGSIDKTHDTLSNISCSTSGYISILDQDGTWGSYQLITSSHTTSLTITSPAASFRLRSFALTPSISSLIPLPTSLTLLAAPTASNTLTLQIWDPQYCVLLSSHNLPIPSTLSHTPAAPLTLSLISTSTTNPQALLVLSPHPSATQSTRASILVFPYTTPPKSTLASAIGLYDASKPFLYVSPSSTAALLPPDSLDPKRITSKLASTSSAKEASKAYHQFVQKSPTDIRNLSPPFVGEVFPLIWPQVEDVGMLLLESGFVTRGMGRDGKGVLQEAWRSGKWYLVGKVFGCVFDLSENDVIEVLKLVITHHRNQNLPNAMQTDPPSPSGEQPSLSTYLTTLIAYPTSTAPLRLAIRRHLGDVEDVVCLMDIMDEWMEGWAQEEVMLLPPATTRDERGAIAWSWGEGFKTKRQDLPPLDKILSFLQVLLDTSFLSLLAYAPAHSVLRRLLAHLGPHILSIEMTEQLRWSLDPFVKAHCRMGKNEKEEKVDDGWGKKRRARNEEAHSAVGVYRLEELVL